MQTIDFNNSHLNLFSLEKVIEILNRDGEVRIIGAAKGTSIFYLAAEFQEMTNALDK